MMRLLAIDPGCYESAWLIFDGHSVVRCCKEKNQDFLDRMCGSSPHLFESNSLASDDGDTLYIDQDFEHVAIETLHPRGMPTALEEMQTQFWAGRFVERLNLPFTQIDRKDEKMVLCGRAAKVTDANIRQAIIDRYGGKSQAIGKKNCPGPLYELSGDLWQAMAIAITWFDTQKIPTGATP